MSNSLRPYGLQPTRLLCPWNFPGKNTGVGCHFLFQGSNSLPPYELQHASLICPPLSPRVCENSYSLSWWCCLTISSSTAPFSFCLHSFPAPVFLPGKSQGQRNLGGYSPWGRKSLTQLNHHPVAHVPSIRVFSNASVLLKEFKELNFCLRRQKYYRMLLCFLTY